MQLLPLESQSHTGRKVNLGARAKGNSGLRSPKTRFIRIRAGDPIMQLSHVRTMAKEEAMRESAPSPMCPVAIPQFDRGSYGDADGDSSVMSKR